MIMNEIIPNRLYLGSVDVILYWKSWLIRENFDGILSLTKRELEPLNLPKCDHLHLKIQDNRSADIFSKFEQCIEFIENHRKVFVHCEAGRSRSASVVIAFLCKSKYGGMRHPEEALSFVKNKRRVVEPNVGFIYDVTRYICNPMEQRDRNFVSRYMIQLHNMDSMVDKNNQEDLDLVWSLLQENDFHSGSY